MAQKTIDWFEKQREQETVDEIAKKVCKNKASAVAFLKSAGIMNEKGELAEQYRQDEQVEPKFKVGDWIIYNKNIELANSLMLVTGKDDNEYLCNYRDGQCSYNIEFIDKEYRLWTIKDAKDGDVLAYDNGCVEIILLFKKWYRGVGKGAYSYAHIISSGHHIHTNDWSDCGLSAHPATKKQLNILFQKMKEEGYEWDAEKKELRKVEQKLIDKIQPKFKVGDIIKNKKNGDTVKVEQILSDSYCYSGWDGAATIHSDFLISDQGNWELVEQKPADNEMIEILRTEYEKGRADAITEFQKEWSEEDERNLYYWLDNNKSIGNDKYRWLLSLKERVQPQNLIITDEELAQAKKDAYNNALDKIEYHSGEPTFDDGWSAAIWYLKKRNAQPRNRWKPSEEQMKALHTKLSYVNGDKELVPDITLESLYNDLKKLKG